MNIITTKKNKKKTKVDETNPTEDEDKRRSTGKKTGDGEVQGGDVGKGDNKTKIRIGNLDHIMMEDGGGIL